MKTFIKTANPHCLQVEKLGLQALGAIEGVRVPEIHSLRGDSLTMELVGPSTAPEDWMAAGKMLADLHLDTHQRFGLDYDNCIGSLLQSNTGHTSWDHFWVDQRIGPQWKLALSKGFNFGLDYDGSFWIQASRSIVINRRPCLIHGDLWSGNLIFDTDGKPVLIDPAIYIGVGAVDIAMTRLFGGFPPAFYQSYNKHCSDEPLTEQEILWYQLYYILVHVNLFGAPYLSQARRMILQIQNWVK